MLFKRHRRRSAIRKLEDHRKVLDDEASQRLKRLCRDSDRRREEWMRVVQGEMEQIVILNKARHALNKIITGADADVDEMQDKQYQTSSIFLTESWKYLISDPGRAERLHLVTGTVTKAETIVLSRMEKVRLERQSPAYVQAVRDDAHQKIVLMDEIFGHRLLGMFHNHCSYGEWSTAPSSTDMKNLERKAAIGIDCLGAIFSLDGFVRFFSLTPFEIDVYGKGVEPVRSLPKQKVFQITCKEMMDENKNSQDRPTQKKAVGAIEFQPGKDQGI